MNSLPPPRDPAAIRVSAAGQLLAVIPALLGGAEPAHSLVVVAAAPPHGKVIGLICCPLPDPPDLTAAYLLAADICDTLADDGAAIILAAGTGPDRWSPRWLMRSAPRRARRVCGSPNACAWRMASTGPTCARGRVTGPKRRYRRHWSCRG